MFWINNNKAVKIFLAAILLSGIHSCRIDTDRFGHVKDGDGNKYSTRLIGTQEWLGENLRTTHYNDGSVIYLADDQNGWTNTTKPAYCWYDNDAGLGTVYGALYNHYALDSAANGGKNICPAGWHVPSMDEWETLAEYVGGMEYAALNLKSKGTLYWDLDMYCKDQFGFSALPGGYRSAGGIFNNVREIGTWWTTTPDGAGSIGVVMSAYYDEVFFDGNCSRRIGSSVRCVKD